MQYGNCVSLSHPQQSFIKSAKTKRVPFPRMSKPPEEAKHIEWVGVGAQWTADDWVRWTAGAWYEQDGNQHEEDHYETSGPPRTNGALHDPYVNHEPYTTTPLHHNDDEQGGGYGGSGPSKLPTTRSPPGLSPPATLNRQGGGRPSALEPPVRKAPRKPKNSNHFDPEFIEQLDPEELDMLMTTTPYPDERRRLEELAANRKLGSGGGGADKHCWCLNR